MLDQSTIDLLVSIEHYRYSISEVTLFHDFFTVTNFEPSDLSFYLLMRSLAEQEIGIYLCKVTSGDSRQIRIHEPQALRLISVYFMQMVGTNESIDDLSKSFFDQLIQNEQDKSNLQIFDDSVQLTSMLNTLLSEYKLHKQQSLQFNEEGPDNQE